MGRENELELLERELTEAHSQLRVIDLVADAGMGKSRLLYEFRQRIGTGAAFVFVNRRGVPTPIGELSY